MTRADLFDQTDAVSGLKRDVDDDQVGMVVFDQRERFIFAFGLTTDLQVVLAGDPHDHAFADHGVVIDNQDLPGYLTFSHRTLSPSHRAADAYSTRLPTIDVQFAANHSSAVGHRTQPHAAAAACGHRFRVEPLPVVAHVEDNQVVGLRQGDGNLVRLAMAQGVMQRLLGDAVQVGCRIVVGDGDRVVTLEATTDTLLCVDGCGELLERGPQAFGIDLHRHDPVREVVHVPIHFHQAARQPHGRLPQAQVIGLLERRMVDPLVSLRISTSSISHNVPANKVRPVSSWAIPSCSSCPMRRCSSPAICSRCSWSFLRLRLVHLPQRIFGLPAFGDVLQRRDGADDASIGVVQGNDAAGQPDGLARTHVVNQHVGLDQRLPLQRPLHAGQNTLCAHPREQLVRMPAEHLFCRDTAQLLHEAIPAPVTQLAVENDQPFLQAAHDLRPNSSLSRSFCSASRRSVMSRSNPS